MNESTAPPRYTGHIKWFVFFAVSVLILLAKWLFDIEGGTDYALVLVGILLTITCLVVLPLFVRRKRMYESLTNGQGVVVSWQMSEAFFAEAAKRKLKNTQERNRAMLIMIGALFLIISVVFLIVLGDDGGFATFLICLGILALLALFALISPRIAYARSLRKGRYAFVGEDAALVGSELHVFSGKTTRLESAEYSPEDKALFIQYRVLTRTGYTPYTAEIPAPDDQASQAAYIAKAIAKKHRL